MDQQALLDLSCFISKMSLRRSPDKAIELETGDSREPNGINFAYCGASCQNRFFT